MTLADLEELYLDARYNCEALRITAKRAGLQEEARKLREAMTVLCGEVRALLAREGRDRVSRGFPPGLLALPPGELAWRCIESASKLPTGSRARDKLLKLARRISSKLGAMREGKERARPGGSLPSSG